MDVVVGGERVWALNGNDGSVIWSAHSDNWVYSSPVIADVTGDSGVDIIIGMHDRVVVLDGSDGAEISLRTREYLRAQQAAVEYDEPYDSYSNHDYDYCDYDYY